MIKTEFALQKQIDNIDIILIEEPENHLSYSNMKKLVNTIAQAKNKQVFLTTHNNMICSRLDLRKLICMNSNIDNALEFNNISEDTANFFIKSPNNNILNFVLSKKVILVEGAAEYILIDKFFEIIENKKMDDCDISVISINGLSFERYLEVAQKLNIKVAVITDNDGDYNKNVKDKYEKYKELDNIKIYAENNNDFRTFEISLYNNNKKYLENNKVTSSKDLQKFMLNNKAENAYRILENLKKTITDFVVPSYICEAIDWIEN